MKTYKNTGYTEKQLDALFRRCEAKRDVSDHLTPRRLVNTKVEDTTCHLAFPADLLRQVTRLARRRRMSPGPLIQEWVKEKLAQAG